MEPRALKQNQFTLKNIKPELNLNTAKLSESNLVVTKQITRLNVLQIGCGQDENKKKLTWAKFVGFAVSLVFSTTLFSKN